MRYVYKVQFSLSRLNEMLCHPLWAILWNTCYGAEDGEERFTREMLVLHWVTTICGPSREVVAQWREHCARPRQISIRQLDASLLLLFPLPSGAGSNGDVSLREAWNLNSSVDIELELSHEAFQTLSGKAPGFLSMFSSISE